MAAEDTIKKTILIGPTHAENGWILQFALRARARSREYDKVVVCCEEEMAYLFSDFAHIMVTYPRKTGKRDRWLYKGNNLKFPPIAHEAKKEANKIYSPNEKHCIRDIPEQYQYGMRIPWDKKYNILIHARSLNQKDWIDKRAGGSRNYPLDRYEQIVKEFEGPIASIGSKEGADYVLGTEDLRGISLERLCSIMGKADVCIGTSSFPLHLANACNCKTIVFTDNKYQKGIHATNRQRYEKLWRMSSAEVIVLDKWGWKPPVDRVIEAMKEMI